MAERSTCLASDRRFSKNAEIPVHQGAVKTMELSETKIVDEHSLSFSQSLGKIPCYFYCGSTWVRNGCSLFDDSDVSTIPSFNDEAVTSQPEDAIKSYHNICDLFLHTAFEEPSTHTVMAGAYESIIDNSQNHSDDAEKAKAASKDFSGCAVSLNCSVLEVFHSDKGSEVDVNLASNTQYQEGVPLQPEPLQKFAEKIQAASAHAEDPKSISKELIGTMGEGIKDSNGRFDINVKPFMDQMEDPVALPTDSTCGKVFQLFPEVATDNALQKNTSKSELATGISFNSCSVSVALPDGCVRREIIQDKPVESSSNQGKLLQDCIRSFKRPQMEATEGFCQKFRPYASFWCEEELDNLWVGVRRHGKDNWHAMLRDPRLQFAPWRTSRDLAEKWRTEQTKLFGSTPGPQNQPSNIESVQLDSYRSSVLPFMLPGPGFLSRFLTDPMQLSLSNTPLIYQGMFRPGPPPPHNSTNVPGNETRLFNRRYRARRNSQRSESKWGRFKVGNQVMPPPRLPNSVSSASRINILPSYIIDALPYTQAFPPLPVPPLSSQYLSNQTQFHDKLNYSAIGCSTKDGFPLSNTITEFPTLAAFPETQRNEIIPTDHKLGKVLINLESDASSEGTISDADSPTLTCK